MNTIYLDHAATTGIRREVLECMLPFLTESWGNPSSLYSLSDAPRKALNNARAQTAALINAPSECIYFTSGGSESDSWALLGSAFCPGNEKKHLITTSIEHHAILNAAGFLKDKGFRVTLLEPDAQGFIRPEQVEAAITPDTFLVSVMTANNEIGTIQPVAELARTAHAHNILFHTDAVQAFGQLPLDVSRLGVDLLSASAHKLNGPKGIGLLYIRKGVRLSPLIFGGEQEQGMRGGTENVAFAVGFGEAARLAALEMNAAIRQESALRDYLIKRILETVPFSRLNGPKKNRLPGNASFSFRFAEGSSLLMLLDARGICASSGSACASSSFEPSHVLKSIRLPDDLARSSLRLTLGKETTKKELDAVISAIAEITAQLRDMSEEYQQYVSHHKPRR